MKPAEIRKLSSDEISARLMDTREELMRLRFQMATGELTDYTRLTATRRLIARFRTILRERDFEVELEGEE